MWLKFLPLLKYIGVFLLVAGVLLGTYNLGRNHSEAVAEAERQELRAAHAEEVARLEKLKRRVEIRYMDRVRVVKEKGEETVKYVEKLVTKEDDSKCDISSGFVELHDSAAENRLPNPGASGSADGTTTGVALSEVGRVIVTNYNVCHQIREQLKSLQEWVRGL